MKACIRDGKTFEAETTKDGRARDITFAADGSVLEVEQQVDRDQVPAPVLTRMDAVVHGGTLQRIETLSRGGSIVRYEVSYTRGGRNREAAFTPDGHAAKAD